MRFVGLALATLLIACGGDDVGGDGGTDGDAGDGGDGGDGQASEPAPPEAPAPPVLTPCPEGWSEVGEAPAIGCAPWALGEAPACEGATARFPGMATCVPLGTACPADGFPADAPAGAVFVSADAPDGDPDGTREAPYPTVGAAIQDLPAEAGGATIAIGVGDYDEALDVPAGITLLGACAASTILRASEARSAHGVLTVVGAGVTVENLQIARSEQAGVWIVGEDRSIALRDVLIDEVRIAGVNAERGARVEGERVLVRDTRSTEGGLFGRGLTIETGATAHFVDLVVDGCTEFAVLSFGAGSRVDLERAALMRTSALPSGVAGAGLVAFEGAALEGSEVVIDEATDIAVLSEGAVSLRDSVVRGTRPRAAEGDRGRGASAQSGHTMRFERVSFEDNRDHAISAGDVGTNLVLSDVIIRRTRAGGSAAPYGRGIGVQDGATSDAQRVFVSESIETAVLVGGTPTSEATFRDLTILDVTPDLSRMRTGRGITIQSGSLFVGERVRIERTGEAALIATDVGTRAVLADVSIRDTTAPPGGAQPSGRGMAAQVGAAIEAQRVRIEASVELGLSALSPGSRIEATDVFVDGALRVQCATAFCAEGGHTLAGYNGASVALRRFDLRGADTCGVHVANGGTIRLTDGVVRGAPIGACVQGDAQDLADLQDGVRYIDNETSLQATMLPVPEPSEAL